MLFVTPDQIRDFLTLFPKCAPDTDWFSNDKRPQDAEEVEAGGLRGGIFPDADPRLFIREGEKY
jgi:hypothetical protein